MNIRSIITISAEGPSLCSGSNAEKQQFNINLEQRRRQEGVRLGPWFINLLSTLQTASSDIYPAWPGSFSAAGRTPSQIHHPLCTREPSIVKILNLGQATKRHITCTSGQGFVTSLIVLGGVGSSLVEMVRQQSVQCVLKRVERSTVVWVKH